MCVCVINVEAMHQCCSDVAVSVADAAVLVGVVRRCRMRLAVCPFTIPYETHLYNRRCVYAASVAVPVPRCQGCRAPILPSSRTMSTRCVARPPLNHRCPLPFCDGPPPYRPYAGANTRQPHLRASPRTTSVRWHYSCAVCHRRCSFVAFNVNL